MDSNDSTIERSALNVKFWRKYFFFRRKRTCCWRVCVFLLVVIFGGFRWDSQRWHAEKEWNKITSFEVEMKQKLLCKFVFVCFVHTNFLLWTYSVRTCLPHSFWSLKKECYRKKVNFKWQPPQMASVKIAPNKICQWQWSTHFFFLPFSAANCNGWRTIAKQLIVHTAATYIPSKIEWKWRSLVRWRYSHFKFTFKW